MPTAEPQWRPNHVHHTLHRRHVPIAAQRATLFVAEKVMQNIGCQWRSARTAKRGELVIWRREGTSGEKSYSSDVMKRRVEPYVIV
ncbi:hypothetical protein N7528_004088 [Penicillium herquei]|nr:hypothetical protein N7528_004088 [Penicillium herquei]